MAAMQETRLYPAIKALLESQGYEVKSEVCACDVVGVRDDEPPVIVEMKTGFTLPLILQGIDRLAMSDQVYLAFGLKEQAGKNNLWRRHHKEIKKLCRRLGLGLISVTCHETRKDHVEVHLDPQPYVPRQNKKRKTALLREFSARRGDPNIGGTSKQKLITAYRQDALTCLAYIARHGPTKVAVLKQSTGVLRAASILQKNHYGWFERIERGIYGIHTQGLDALKVYQAHLLD